MNARDKYYELKEDWFGLRKGTVGQVVRRPTGDYDFHALDGRKIPLSSWTPYKHLRYLDELEVLAKAVER